MTTVQNERDEFNPDPSPLNHDYWKEFLYDRLRDSARPLFIFDETTIPGASVWSGSRRWVEQFRDQGLSSGDRLVLDLPPGPAFIQTLVAGIWEKLSLIIPTPDDDPETLLRTMDARAIVTYSDNPSYRYKWTTRGVPGPERAPEKLRVPQYPPSPEVRFLLRTSGTKSTGSWYGLSDRNVLSVLSRHRERLRPVDSVLSYLPWHHCFGLVLGLLYYIDARMVVYRDSHSGRSSERLAALAGEHSVDQFNAVPLTIQQLARNDHTDFLNSLREGIVGGAPLRKPVVKELSGTDMRVGYGQTEASPGIMLGSRGQFSVNLLGEPVGCDVRITENGGIEFHGLNAHRASLDDGDGLLQYHEVPRWVSTGDRGRLTSEGYVFHGRTDSRIKLPNGRYLDPDRIEKRIVNTSETIREAMVRPNEEGYLLVHVVTNAELEVPEEDVLNEFDSIQPYVDNFVRVPEDELPRSKKGEIQRESITTSPGTIRNGGEP